MNDWLYDEIRLSDDAVIVHEIEFAGGYWVIGAENIDVRWIQKG